MTGPARWPLTLKVPALVAALMIVVSAAISQQVMRRLVETQERQLAALAGAYLDGLASSLMPHVLREDVWEVYDALDRSAALYDALSPIETVVVGREGRVIASSDPRRTPALEPLPARYAERLAGATLVIDAEAGRAFVRRALTHQAVTVGAVHAVLDIGHLLAERRAVIATLLATNAGLTLLLGAAGYLAVRRMIVPMRVLADHLTRGGADGAAPIPPGAMPAPGSEAHRLFDAFNRLVDAQRESRALARRLAGEERHASLGRLASGLAHEINNPLGGLFNALDMLRRHGDDPAVRAPALGLLDRGLAHVRDVVAAALQSCRPEGSPRPFGPADLADVRLLAGPEARRRALRLDWVDGLDGPLALPGAPLRQALLNLVLNTCAATPPGRAVTVRARREAGRLVLSVEDGGPGLPAAAAALLHDPEARAPIGESRGLGLWIVRRAVTDLGGTIACDRGPDGGARIRLAIPIPATERADAA